VPQPNGFAIEGGEEIVITRHGKPVVPIGFGIHRNRHQSKIG
jgi:antitoxin (DNA-binding transcriptional repressor) of toxin-antitoxin stability system